MPIKSALRRLASRSAASIVLCILAGQVGSPQFRDIYNKTKKKAQDTISKTINGTDTASGPAPKAPPPNADLSGDTGTTTSPVPANSRLSRYDFCGMMVGHIKYYSEVFTLPIEAAHLSASPAIVSVLPLQFRTFLTQKYGAQAMRGGTGCSGGWETEEVAKEQKRRDQIGFQSLNLPDGKIVETDFRWSGAMSVAPPPASGSVGLCYASISDRAAHTITYYGSSIFPATSDVSVLALKYGPFVSSKYGARTSGRGTGVFCNEFKSQADAEQEIERQRRNPQQMFIDTGWSPSGVGATPVPERSSLYQSSDDLAVAIETEFRSAPSWCEHQAGILLSGNYDCPCVAEKVHEQRLSGQVKFAKAAGGRVLLEPEIGIVLNAVDLRSCASPAKITSYVSKNILDTFAYGTPPAQRQAMASCASQKMVAHLQSDPHGLEKIDNYNRQDVSDCNRAIVIGK